MNRQPKGVQRTTLRLDPDLLRALSDAARREACTRSALMARILRDGVGKPTEAARAAP